MFPARFFVEVCSNVDVKIKPTSAEIAEDLGTN